MILHAFIDKVIQTRQQIAVSQEVNKLNGWEDPLNNWMMQEFAVLTGDLDQMLALSSESVPMSAMFAHTTVAHDLTGRSKNLRQPTQYAVRNVGLRNICTLLDHLAVQCTHFDSRWGQSGINQMEHDQAETFLTRTFGICRTHGGRANLRPLISGVLPEDLDDSFNYEGNHDQQLGTTDVGEMALADGFRVRGSGNQIDGLHSDARGGSPAAQAATGTANVGAGVGPNTGRVPGRPAVGR